MKSHSYGYKWLSQLAQHVDSTMYCLRVIALFSLQSLTQTYSLTDHHKLLLVSFDGLKWNYIDQRPDLEAFHYLRENGVKAEYLIPPFPTLTSPCHTTIATGLYVESHGVVHNVYFNRSSSEVVEGDYYTTLAVNEWWDNGDEPIWITASSQGLKSGGYLFPGSNATIGGRAATRSIMQTGPMPCDEVSWKANVDDVMSWFADDSFDFIALYFEEPDYIGHAAGPKSERVGKETLPVVDHTISYILEKAKEYGIDNDLNIIITSDHGMTEVNTTVGVDDAISFSKYVDDSDILFQFPYDAIAFVEPYPDKLKKVYDQLQRVHPHLQAYYKEDLAERLHYSNNDRIPSIVLAADLGYTIHKLFSGVHHYRGNHGYDNRHQDMRASFYAIGPSFKENYTVPGFESVHIYELMCHLLGLTPAPNNGSLEVLLPTLKETKSAAVQVP